MPSPHTPTPNNYAGAVEKLNGVRERIAAVDDVEVQQLAHIAHRTQTQFGAAAALTGPYVTLTHLMWKPSIHDEEASLE